MKKNKEGSVETDESGGVIVWEIKEKGFNIAHERELSQEKDSINLMVGVFTFFLVLAEIVGVVPLAAIYKTLDVLLLAVALLIILLWTDILKA